VIAKRQHISAGHEKRPRHLRRQTKPVGGVFSIHHNKIKAQFLTQPRQRGYNRITPGAAYDIAQEK
jgi:hypothetical protein